MNDQIALSPKLFNMLMAEIYASGKHTQEIYMKAMIRTLESLGYGSGTSYVRRYMKWQD